MRGSGPRAKTIVKKTIAIILCMTLALSLAACGKNEEGTAVSGETQTEETQTEETVTEEKETPETEETDEAIEVFEPISIEITADEYPDMFTIEELPSDRARSSAQKTAMENADANVEGTETAEKETVLSTFTPSADLIEKRTEARAYAKETGDYSVFTSTVTIPEKVDVVGDRAFLGVVGVTDVSFDNSDCEIDEWGFASMDDLRSFTSPSNLKVVSQGLCDACECLETVILADTVITIGDDAFSKCYTLKTADIPDGVETIGVNAFDRCYVLSGIKMPSSLKSIGNYAFTECGGLEELNFAEGLETIGDGAFFKCENLKSVTLPSTVKSIGGGAFRYCPNLTEVIIPEGCDLGDNVFDDTCNVIYK